MEGFVTLDNALKLKKIGFDLPCISRYYNSNFEFSLSPYNHNDGSFLDSVSAPSNSQVMYWLEEKHGITIMVSMDEVYWDVVIDEEGKPTDVVEKVVNYDFKFEVHEMIKAGDNMKDYPDDGRKLVADSYRDSRDDAENDAIDYALEVVENRQLMKKAEAQPLDLDAL